MERFLESLSRKVLVCDGAMGTMLYSRGVYLNKCFDELNLTNPSMVEEIHREYVNCGVDIIETNTFGANKFRLLPFGLENKVREINLAGVEIARRAAGGNCMVAGAIGPINAHLKPLGGVSRDELHVIYKEQIEALIEGGADILIMETFPGIEMIKVALWAARDVTKIPIVAQVTVNDYGNTLLEESPEKVALGLKDSGADVIGINCSVGPSVILESLTRMRQLTSMPLSAMPNAGIPQIVEGRFIYLSSPEYMAEYAKRFIQSGVNLMGGCCGTTPNHMKAIVSAVRALEPGKIKVGSIKVPQERSVLTEEVQDEKKSDLAMLLKRKEFVRCVEMDPPRGSVYEDYLSWVKRLIKAGINAVNIADGPRASARMSPLALASLILQNTGMDVILHFCCRDRNILGMQSDLLGANALGIRNILAVTGDPPKLGDYPNATAVFDVDSIGLLKIASRLNRGLDVAGNPIGQPTSLFLGAGFNPGAINMDEEYRRLELKLESGAKFIMTQPVFDIDALERTLKRVLGLNVPVLGGILPLYSLRNAEFLNNEVPGMAIPPSVMERIRKAPTGEKAREEGVTIAREAISWCKSALQGIYIMPPFGKYEMAIRVLEP